MTKNDLYKLTGVGSYYDQSYRCFVACWPQKLAEDQGKNQTTMMKVLWVKEDCLEVIAEKIREKKAQS